MRNIAVVTGSRSDYGLLRGVLKLIDEHPLLELKIIATGMHFSQTFGNTIKEVREDNFGNLIQVPTLRDHDDSLDIARAISVGIDKSAEVLSRNPPDILLVIGDRYETFAVAIAALSLRIPIAHIHGGEITLGLIDEAIRHSLTKMSHIHFVSNEIYRRRVIQLGEDPDKVFVVGGLGIDQIRNTNWVKKSEIEKTLSIKFREKNILVTFHPVTLEPKESVIQFAELLYALEELTDTSIILTFPNADPESLELIAMAKSFATKNQNVYLFQSLGQDLYYSILCHVDGLVGNSSSGLLEAPTFKIGTVNIGLRQEGRLKSKSVIDCFPEKKSISNAINLLLSSSFKSSLFNVVNVNGEPGASSKIVDTLSSISLDGILIKPFHDLDCR